MNETEDSTGFHSFREERKIQFCPLLSFCVTFLFIHQQERWPMMIQTPRGAATIDLCPFTSDPSHRTEVSSELARISESPGRESKGDLWFPRGPAEGGPSFTAASCSAKCSWARWASSHLGQREELSMMVEDVTRWICASMWCCSGRSSSLLEQTNYRKHLVEMVVKPLRLHGLWRTTEICRSYMVQSAF